MTTTRIRAVDAATPAGESAAGRGGLGLVRRVAPPIGSAAALAGVVVIWAARASVPHWVYVSELGAQGAPTAHAFAAALLAIAFGGGAIACGVGRLRSAHSVLGAWPVAATIAASAVCFVVASQVTCTSTCPVPFVNPRSQPQDLVHITFAVIGFALACYAMLQCALVRGHRLVRGMSLVACCAVALITALGGMLAIVHVAVDLGAAAEYAGMTVAIGWLAVFGVSLAFAPPSRLERVVQASTAAQAPSARNSVSS